MNPIVFGMLGGFLVTLGFASGEAPAQLASMCITLDVPTTVTIEVAVPCDE